SGSRRCEAGWRAGTRWRSPSSGDGSAVGATNAHRQTHQPLLPWATRMSVDGRDDITIAASDAGAPRVGSVLAGRYLIERQVGRGGMGMVYCALDRQLGERVALKILTVPDEKEAALERFRREVRVARRVTHRNAARTYDIGEHGGFHYLTMELIEGRSLEREL